MLIEFCCPVCLAPLAVEPKIAGGQVNCPKCLKLILIPDKTILVRNGEHSPFGATQKHPGDAVTKAISLSVEPYRRELETKTGLLNDAVEMIKTRNQRIKEIESLILRTQKELWELEVHNDGTLAEHQRVLIRLEDTQKEIAAAAGAPTPEQTVAISELESDIQELEAHIHDLEEKKESLKVRLTHLADLAHAQQKDLATYKVLVDSLESVKDFIRDTREWMDRQQERFAGLNHDLESAQTLLKKATAEVDRLQALVVQRDGLRLEAEKAWKTLQSEMETLLSSSSQDVQYAIKEREQWKHRSEKASEEVAALKESTAREVEKAAEEVAALKESTAREVEKAAEEVAALKESTAREVERSERELAALKESSARELEKAAKEAAAVKERSAAEGEQAAKELATLRESSAKALEEADLRFETLKTEFHRQEELLEDALRVQQDIGEDRRQILAERKELEQSLELLRKRQVQEHHDLHIQMEAEKAKFLTDAHKREAGLEQKLRQIRGEYSEQETRLEEALRNQQQLAEQSFRSEKQRSELKKQLEAALERLEALGQSGV
jgi:chromosome segregation ATPase